MNMRGKGALISCQQNALISKTIVGSITFLEICGSDGTIIVEKSLIAIITINRDYDNRDLKKNVNNRRLIAINRR